MIQLPWSGHFLTVDIKDHTAINHLEPLYPPPLTPAGIRETIVHDLSALTRSIKQAKRIVLVLEDPSRPSDTRFLVETIVEGIRKIRGDLAEFHLVVAAGAHYQLVPRHLLNKVPQLSLPIIIHDSRTESDLTFIGTSQSGIPLFFNKTVADAGLRLSISTVNIHPLAGFSGGGKILLPGVAGLKTIYGLHSLPSGKSGVYHSAMRELIDEVLKLLPIDYSWHLISHPDGSLVKICSGPTAQSHAQAKQTLLNLVSCHPPEKKASLVLLGCKPFDQNLIGTFKSLPQIPPLLAPGGRAVLFNQASQGTGCHYWRNDPQINVSQKNHYRSLLQDFQVAVYSPYTNLAQFQNLFPAEFSLLQSMANLMEFIIITHASSVTVMPYAPITLISG